jgi:hypothetical protein
MLYFMNIFFNKSFPIYHVGSLVLQTAYINFLIFCHQPWINVYANALILSILVKRLMIICHFISGRVLRQSIQRNEWLTFYPDGISRGYVNRFTKPSTLPSVTSSASRELRSI